jgi:AraC-like DNA-binding protein
MEMKLALDELENLPGTFCGAAWMDSFDFSYISKNIELVLGHPHQNFFSWGVVYFHSIVPAECIASINRQLFSQLDILKRSTVFEIDNSPVFKIKSLARNNRAEIIPLTQSLVCLDCNDNDQTYFFISCWQATQNERQAIEKQKEIEGALLRCRHLYKELYPKKLVATKNDNFISTINSIIVEKISDPDFNIDQLAGCVHLSRMQLHRRLMRMIQQSPGEFLRNARLEKARELLLKGNQTTSQIAYQTGFENLSYFSKIFKQRYSILPSRIKASVSFSS